MLTMHLCLCGAPATHRLLTPVGLLQVCSTCLMGSQNNTMPIIKASSFPPGASEWFKTPDGAVVIGCPKCRNPISVGPQSPQNVGSDGSVFPSLICPYQECGFHLFVFLNDWRS